MISRRHFLSRCFAAITGITVAPKILADPNVDRAVTSATPVSDGSFRRLFSNAIEPTAEPALKLLAEAMTSLDPTPTARSLRPGWTYFGQFIDHDLTWNQASLDDGGTEQTNPHNFRSSFLDLDQVYGAGPPSKGQFTGPTGEESFVIGETLPSPNLGLKGGSQSDVPFDGKRPIIGDHSDFRDTENLILRQLHVVFLKFHNRIITLLPRHGSEPELPQKGTLFDRARQLATWTYQWLVWNDFLNKVVEPSKWRKLRRLPGNQIPNSTYQLSLEFILAGFRFGHSMVLNGYPLNCHHKEPVPLIFLINPSHDSADRLAEEYVIEWGIFFPGAPHSAGVRLIRASAIDTHIAAALGKLPSGLIPSFSFQNKGVEILNLAHRTLLRGARAKLASGQQAVAELKGNNYQVPNISNDLKQDKALEEAKLTENTPLWYYILKEAEVTQHGDSLGSVGTYIVLDAIEGALQNDPNSFLVQHGEDWEPPTWILPADKRDMGGLIEFAGAGTGPQGCSQRQKTAVRGS